MITKNFDLKRFTIDALEYLVMFMVVIYGQSVYIRINYEYKHYFYIDIAVFIMIMMLVLIRGMIYKVSLHKVLINFVIWGTYLMIYHETYKIIICHILLPLTASIIYFTILIGEGELESFITKYFDIVVILATLSVLCYIFGTFLHILPVSYDTYIWAGRTFRVKNYFHLMYEAQREIFFGHVFVRNCGIFCEAPSYAVPLILSIFYEVLIRENKQVFRIGILFVTILTSFSTKALLICVIIAGLRLFQRAYLSKSNSLLDQITRLLLPTFLVLLGVFFIALIEQKSKIQYSGRMSHYYASFAAFKDNWLFGVGIGNEAAVAKYLSRNLAWKGFSVGATLILAEGGLLFAAFFIFGWLNALVNCRKKWNIICLGIIHFAVLFTSNISLFLSTMMILALEYSFYAKNRVGLEHG